MQSLFGDEIPNAPARKRDDRAHAARPGTGPAGMFCRDCLHRHTIKLAKSYQKCALMRHCWSGGRATDILCKDAACKYFTPQNAD